MAMTRTLYHELIHTEQDFAIWNDVELREIEAWETTYSAMTNWAFTLWKRYKALPIGDSCAREIALNRVMAMIHLIDGYHSAWTEKPYTTLLTWWNNLLRLTHLLQ